MTSDILFAGAAKEITTPPIGTFLYGYRPDITAESVHDDLSVTALALKQGDSVALMITAEIGDIQTELCAETIKKIAASCCIDEKCILISSTHTHSAPNLSGVEGWGDIDTDYYNNIFLPAILKASKNAFSLLAPAEIAVGVTHSEVGINRRQQFPDGNIGLGQNPHGCYDPNMTVVAIRNSETKEGILNLVHYGCHGTSAGLNREITRDWSGIMIDRLEKETNTLTAFWNGAIGDVGPRLTNGETTGNISYTEELGGVAAFDAVRAYHSKGGYFSRKLEVLTDTVTLPYKSMPTLEEAEKKLASYTEPEKLINLHRLKYAHDKEVYEYLKNGGKPETAFGFEQTIITLGDIVFIPFPYEPFSEIVLRLREYSGYPYTLCLSCTNGYNVYLPSEDQLCRGGYEVDCFLYGHLFPLENCTDKNIINENLRILRKE